MQRIIVDTNVLIDGLQVYDFEKIYIPSVVLDELDNLKRNKDFELAYKAKEAIKMLEGSDNIEVRWENLYSVPLEFSNDNKIISFAKDVFMFDKECVFLSNDYNVRLKAKHLGIPCESYNQDNNNKVYKGYKEVVLSDLELACFYEECKANKWDLIENEYLIIKNENIETVDVRRWTSKGFVELKTPNIKGIKSKNDLQLCAFDLMNSNIPIKILLGKPGSGKTFINLKSALYFLDKGKYQRIIYIRNPIGKGESIGFLPGTQLEKLEPFAQAIIDNLEMGEAQFKQMISQERLQFDCPYFLKGASKDASWFLVDEAEDLDVETLRLIGTRLAKDSVICFSGDLYQTEKKYKNNNGLTSFIEKFKGNPLVGIVKLDEDVRSEVSKLFGDL